VSKQIRRYRSRHVRVFSSRDEFLVMHLTVLCCCFVAVLWVINIVVCNSVWPQLTAYSFSSCYKLIVVREKSELHQPVFSFTGKRQCRLRCLETYIHSTDGLQMVTTLNSCHYCTIPVCFLTHGYYMCTY